jgi:hypothetical protein
LSYILTFAGTLLCQKYDTGEIVQRPIHGIGDDVEPVEIEFPIEQLRPTYDQFTRNTFPELDLRVQLGALGPLRITRAWDRRCLAFSRDELFLTAYGGVLLSQVKVSDWERFLPVAKTDLDVLRGIIGNSWVVRSSGAFVAQNEVRLDVWFALKFGGLSVDLRYQLPFDLTSWPFRLIVLRDAWKIEAVCLFRPLVYFTAYCDPAVVQQLYESIRSLIDIGCYAGAVLVFTDRDASEIARNVPQVPADQLSVYRTEPTDLAGFVSSKYAILDIPWAAQFQPILFCDPDVVFDADVAPMLYALARSDRIAAPAEEYAPMRSAASAGSGLLQLDGCSPGLRVGFNAGTLGIPNLAAHGATLRLIRTIIINHSDDKGRQQLGWIDQEVANYVSFRLADFDTHLISGHVRYGGWPGTEPDINWRGGAVHFWPAGGTEETLDAMRRYRGRLDELLQRID